MNPTDTLTNLFSHNMWANLTLFQACAALTDEQLDATLPGTFGTIRDTLRHITLAEKGYLSRISTGERYHHPKDAPPMSVEDMIESLRASGQSLIEWASKVQPEDTVQIDWDGTPRDVPKTVILTQVINHATEHRAQVMVIMTQLGVQPPEIDSWEYFDQIDTATGN